MSNDFQPGNQFNPYQSTPASFEPNVPQFNKVKVQAPAIAASIVSMFNVGSCCCVIGLPIGIWALVILLMGDVKRAFEFSARS